MEEKTLFKPARAITDTSTDTVSSKGGTVTYRITSLKRKLVNGKVVSTSTPSCTLGSASVSWATWGGVTVGDGYLDVKINYSENTGSSRSTTLTFDQNESDNKINLTVTQGSKLKPVKQFILTGLPLNINKPCYLFASGSRPQSGSGTSGYLMVHGVNGSALINIPVRVNLSSYGDTTEADTGDRVTVWTSSGSSFSQIGSFTVPSAGETVSI